MKKQILLFGITMLLNVASAFAQSGTWGSLTWQENGDTLIISGIGNMPDFTGSYTGPWCNDNGSSIYCPFSTVIIENGLTSIGGSAFAHFYRLISVSIPSSVTIIEVSAFGECTRLTSITNLNPIPVAINPNVFYNVNANTCTLYVPRISVSAYKTAPVWREFNVVGIEIGIEEFESKSGGENQLLIYPNPTTGNCSITIPEEFLYESNLILSIYDNSGKLLQQIPIENGFENFNLQLEHKATGVYPVVLGNGRKSYKGKVVFN
jgi:hypothetical protein